MLDRIQAHDTLLWWLAAASVVTFFATLIAVPLAVVRIPADYFAHRKRHRVPWADRHPVVRIVLRTTKNLLGGFFIVAGVVMLVLPGQGVLTVLIGLMLLDFPGKFRFERWLVSRRPIRRTIRWLRVRAGVPPLVVHTPRREAVES